jgi:hypothetical protein
MVIMARIIRKSNALREKHALYLKITVICYLISFICFIAEAACLMLSLNIGIFSFVLPAGFVLFGGIGGVMIEKTKSVKAGFKGEEAVADIIADFPDEYFGFLNTTISFDDKVCETDLIVVGPTGVFVIEVKNLNGEIRGSYDEKYWTQHKVGRGGTPYSRNFYSPVKQVGTHVYALAGLLKNRGAGVFVEGLVYISNPDTEVTLTGNPGRYTVFSASDGGKYKLTRYITKRNHILSKEGINEICRILNKV